LAFNHYDAQNLILARPHSLIIGGQGEDRKGRGGGKENGREEKGWKRGNILQGFQKLITSRIQDNRSSSV